MPARRFSLDGSYRRPDGGNVLIAGSPLRLFTLSDAGVRVLEAVERGEPLPDGHERLTDRLLDAGALHPLAPEQTEPPDRALERITVVVPARGEWPRFRPSACRTIVVDDASTPPLAHADTSTELVRLDRNIGPGGARNAGLASVVTELVAFVDTDVDVDEAALAQLATLFADPRVALVAPRVRASTDQHGRLAAYERRHSPLDLGAAPARVAPTTRVSYVPAAVIVCRTAAVRAIGGFDESLRFGEDVDLVWRLASAGHRCRYEPAVVVRHRVRASLAAWCRQRCSYGSSAAPLAERHGAAVAPLRMSGWSGAAWAAVVAGFPITGLSIGVATTVALVRKLRTVPARESLRLAGTGHLYAGRLVAGAISRSWWPIALVLAVVSRRARRAVIAAVLVPALLDWRDERPDLDPATYVGLRVLDDASYGAGVWRGAWRARSVAALLPSFESWPPRGDRR